MSHFFLEINLFIFELDLLIHLATEMLHVKYITDKYHELRRRIVFSPHAELLRESSAELNNAESSCGNRMRFLNTVELDSSACAANKLSFGKY